MRLLHVDSRELVEFHGEQIPPYAILSHTWGEEEVTFHDLAKEGHRKKRGYAKIEGCCQQAKRDQLDWMWVDTCCIDKSSSAELSEAINSMYRWYEDARVCYAYLEDVPSEQDPYQSRSAFQQSRWFTRGWTLQELLAPGHVVFFAVDWVPIFDPDITHLASTGRRSGWVAKRNKYIGLLSGITTISRKVLEHEVALDAVSAACKFSWAASRATTRVEDMAYCLLGLLGVNMPLLYGEGYRAFIRLQEAVLNSSMDISLLAWGYDMSWKVTHNEFDPSILARSTSAFLGYPRGNYLHVKRMPRTHTTVSGHGVHMELLMLPIDKRNKVWLGIVEEYAGQHDEGHQTGIAIVLRQSREDDTLVFHRAGGCPPIRTFYPRRVQRLSRGPRPKLVYLQSSYSMPLAALEGNFSRGVWRFFRPQPHPRIATGSEESHTISISLTSVNKAGFFLSSLYPPKWHRASALLLPDNSEIACLYCEGRHNRTFYSIFAIDRKNRFAMRVRVQWELESSYQIAFCKLTANQHGTAVEHFCDTRIGWRAPPIETSSPWKDHVNLWNPSTLELGHLRVRRAEAGEWLDDTCTDCSLDWVPGHR